MTEQLFRAMPEASKLTAAQGRRRFGAFGGRRTAVAAYSVMPEGTWIAFRIAKTGSGGGAD